jgi:hypothetical protein
MKLFSKLAILAFCASASASRQGFFQSTVNTLANIEEEVFGDQLHSFDLSSLKKGWEGDVVQTSEFPDYALRVKETQLCDSVKQVILKA